MVTVPDPLASSPANPTRRGELGAFGYGMLESGVLLLALAAAERLFFGAGFYAGLVQHPFWIVVLLASVQGGLYVGVGTAALAALMMERLPRAVGVDITEHYIHSALLPLQWLIVALSIGLYRQFQLSREAALQAENARLREMADLLAAEVERSDVALEAAELRAILAQPETPGILPMLEALDALRRVSPEALPASFHDTALRLSPLPTLLLLPGPTGLTSVFGESNWLPPLDEPLRHKLADSRVEIVPAGQGNGLAVLAAVGGTGAEGCVALHASTLDEAEGARPLARLLAGAVEMALQRAAGGGQP